MLLQSPLCPPSVAAVRRRFFVFSAERGPPVCLLCSRCETKCALALARTKTYQTRLKAGTIYIIAWNTYTIPPAHGVLHALRKSGLFLFERSTHTPPPHKNHVCLGGRGRHHCNLRAPKKYPLNTAEKALLRFEQHSFVVYLWYCHLTAFISYCSKSEGPGAFVRPGRSYFGTERRRV